MLLSGVSWLFMVVWNFISEATTPNLYATWFTGGPFAVMRTVAIARADAGGAAGDRRGGVEPSRQGALLRSVAQDFPKALFLLTALLFITTLGLGFADAVSAWLMGMFSGSANDFATAMSSVAGELQFGAGLLVVMFTAVLMILVLLARGRRVRVPRRVHLLPGGDHCGDGRLRRVPADQGGRRPVDAAAGRRDHRQADGRAVLRLGRRACSAPVGAAARRSGEVAEPGTDTVAVDRPGRCRGGRRERRRPVGDVRHPAGRDGDDDAGGRHADHHAALVPAANAPAAAEGQQAVTAKVASAASKAAAAL